MELTGFQMHSFPMNPSVFYAFKELSFKTRNFEKPIVISAELLIRKDSDRVLIKQGTAKTPDFMIVSRPTDGFMKATLKSTESTLRDLIYSTPTGDIISGGGKSIAEIISVFSAIPVADGSMSFRLPIVVSENIQFENNMGSIFPIERGVFELNPQRFGFIFATTKGLNELIHEIEGSLRASFSGIENKKS